MASNDRIIGKPDCGLWACPWPVCGCRYDEEAEANQQQSPSHEDADASGAREVHRPQGPEQTQRDSSWWYRRSAQAPHLTNSISAWSEGGVLRLLA